MLPYRVFLEHNSCTYFLVFIRNPLKRFTIHIGFFKDGYLDFVLHFKLTISIKLLLN